MNGCSGLGAGRYAPSPSGELHLGNLRTALVAWLFARSSGRQFLMRSENLDRDRDTGSACSQLDDLRSIGLDWDGELVVQTERVEKYEAAIAELSRLGLVYECTCTRKDVLTAPTAPHQPLGFYPGTCRSRSERERRIARNMIAPRKAALRVRVPSGTNLVYFDDVMLGRQASDVDDFVLRRGDGTISYNLAVVVDDAAMGVDQVVRGGDLASSTPRQIVLQRLLGLPTPPVVEYAHVPLVLGSHGKRLAKRDGAVTLREFAQTGVSAAEVLSMLAVSLRLATPGEVVNTQKLLQRFTPERLPLTPWVWDQLSL